MFALSTPSRLLSYCKKKILFYWPLFRTWSAVWAFRVLKKLFYFHMSEGLHMAVYTYKSLTEYWSFHGFWTDHLPVQILNICCVLSILILEFQFQNEFCATKKPFYYHSSIPGLLMPQSYPWLPCVRFCVQQWRPCSTSLFSWKGLWLGLETLD